jgi:hypothetical protein
VEVDRGAAGAVDHHPRDVAQAADLAAFGRGASLEPHRGRAEALAENDVHDALVGAVAIFERDFLGQDLDPLDGLGGDVAKLAEAGNALAVQEQDGPLAASPAGAADLRREGFEELGDVGRAGGPDVTAGERILLRDVADDRASRTLPDDDDVIFLGLFVDRRLRRRGSGRLRGNRRCGLAVLRLRGGGEQEGDAGQERAAQGKVGHGHDGESGDVNIR